MRLVRGSKIKLTEFDPRLVEEAMRPKGKAIGHATGTAAPDGIMTTCPIIGKRLADLGLKLESVGNLGVWLTAVTSRATLAET